MITRRRGFTFFPVVLLAAAVAVVVAAALTTWWVLLVLIPLTMMLGCAAMMTTGRMPCTPRASRDCCAAGRTLPRHLHRDDRASGHDHGGDGEGLHAMLP